MSTCVNDIQAFFLPFFLAGVERISEWLRADQKFQRIRIWNEVNEQLIKLGMKNWQQEVKGILWFKYVHI